MGLLNEFVQAKLFLPPVAGGQRGMKVGLETQGADFAEPGRIPVAAAPRGSLSAWGRTGFCLWCQPLNRLVYLVSWSMK